MVAGVKELAGDWQYDVVSIGYPGLVLQGRVVAEPPHLAPGWVGFDFAAACERPVKIINDAAMQALGSYKAGTLLFLGLGTGLGSALVSDGVVVPLELGHFSYRKGTCEDYVGQRGLKRRGKKKWREDVESVVERLVASLHPDDVVLGGGNVDNLKQLPPGCRAGDNAHTFLGGFRLWESSQTLTLSPAPAEPAAAPGSTTTQARSTPPTAHRAWQALAAHYEHVRRLHLRQLFADDPARGERLTVEAVGLYLDYSKNRITDETLRLLLQLAEAFDLRGRIE